MRFLILCLLVCDICCSQKDKDKYLANLAKDIHFKYKDTLLKKSSYKTIENIARYLIRNNNYYTLESHTCAYGLNK